MIVWRSSTSKQPVPKMAERVPLPRRDPRFEADEMRRFFAPQPQMQLQPGDELPFAQRLPPMLKPNGADIRSSIPPEVLMQLLGVGPLGHSYPDVLPPFPFDVQSEKSI